MEGNEVDGTANASRFQFFNDLISANPQGVWIDAYDIKMPGVARIMRFWRAYERIQGGQFTGIARCNGAPAGSQVIRFGELGESDGSLKIGKIVFESRLEDVIPPSTFGSVALPCIPADAMEAEDAHPFGILGVFGRNHPAFTSGDRLCGVEREASDVPQGPDHPPLITGGKRVRGIFNHFQSVAMSDIQNCVHLAWITSIVHRYDCPRAAGDGLLDLLRVDVKEFLC